MEFRTHVPAGATYKVDYGPQNDEEMMLDNMLRGELSPIRKAPSPRRSPLPSPGGAAMDDDDFGSDDSEDDAADRARSVQRAKASPRARASPRASPRDGGGGGGGSPPRDAAAELRAQRAQIHKMGVLLEALAPIPGVEPRVLLEAMDDPNHGDLRDQKIVAMARKTRNATVAIERERNNVKRLAEKVAQLERDKAMLVDELAERAEREAAHMPFSVEKRKEREAAAAREAAAKRNPDASPRADGTPSKPTRREQQLAKQCAEMRRKFEAARSETQQLARALAKEVGDESVAAGPALEDGWRGRAQQIVILKNKVRALEDGRADARPKPPRRGVDADARHEISCMEKERTRAVEELTQAHHDTTVKLAEVSATLKASKARNDSQAQECAKNRDHIKSLLEKTDGDDALVEALRAETSALNEKLRDVQQRHAAEARDAAAADSRTRRPDPDVQRLKRENARLQEQVDRQHVIIRKFRAADDDRRTAANREYVAPSP